MNKPQINILMLGGARRVSFAQHIKQSGKNLGYSVNIISYELEPHVPIAAEAQVIIGKKWNDPQIISHLQEIILTHNINIILPFVDGAIEIAAKCHLANPKIFAPISDLQTSLQMYDKTTAAQSFQNLNIPTPKTLSPDNLTFPAIAKPRKGSASQGIKILRSQTDADNLTNPQNYLIQQYIENNQEYTIDAYISQKGEILCTVPRIRLEVSSGEVTKTKTQKLPQLITLSRQIISRLNLKGAVTLQFLLDKQTQQFLLMEINPRLGGGVICSICAKAPITDYILKESQNQPLNPCNDWIDNTLMVRYRKEIIFYE